MFRIKVVATIVLGVHETCDGGPSKTNVAEDLDRVARRKMRALTFLFFASADVQRMIPSKVATEAKRRNI